MEKKHRVVTFHYDLTDDQGVKLDSSRERNQPMTYLENSGQIIPGLDIAIKELSQGDKETIKVEAKDAYGEYDLNLVFTVKRSQFPSDAEMKVGQKFQAKTEEGMSPVFTIMSADLDSVKLDGNHPMAGKTLTFEVEILSAREANEEELAHGHSHGEDGHHHH